MRTLDKQSSGHVWSGVQDGGRPQERLRTSQCDVLAGTELLINILEINEKVPNLVSDCGTQDR